MLRLQVFLDCMRVFHDGFWDWVCDDSPVLGTEARRVIVDRGGVPTLLAFLSSESQEIRLKAARCLWALVFGLAFFCSCTLYSHLFVWRDVFASACMNGWVCA